MEYLGQINKGEVRILHVPTGKMFHSWQSVIEFDNQPQPAPPQKPNK